MKEIKGKYTTAKIFTDNVEETAIKQIQNMTNHEMTENATVRIMPDTHAGSGTTIGTTIKLPENFADWKVSPNIVGVDINCFTGDTKVKLADGRSLTFLDLIEEDKKGIINYCFSKDAENNTQISKIDLPRKIDEVSTLVHIELDNGEMIKTTKDHVFYKRDGMEVEACKLQKDDSLMPLYIEKIKYVRDYISGYSEKTLGTLREYLAVYNSGSSNYSIIHHLSDNYNERNKLIDENARYDNGVKSYVRHHKDFDKYNNNPNNIERMGYIEHWKWHADNIHMTNKMGLTGFKKANKVNPGLHSRAGKKRAEATWKGPNAEQNRIDKSILAKKGFMNTDLQRDKARQRQLINNSNDFANLNSNPEFIWKQKQSKYAKIAHKCLKEYGVLNEETWEKSRLKISKNSPKYNTMIKDLKKNDCDMKDLLSIKVKEKNHKVISIKIVNYSEPVSVYCLTNHEFGNFALDAGVFVSNCGVLMYKLKDNSVDLEKLDKVINKYVPSGFNIHNKAKDLEFTQSIIDKLTLKLDGKPADRVHKSLGTLGGGNHFIELGLDEEENYWLAVHSGSRNLGVQVAQHHQDIAIVELTEANKVDIGPIVEQLKKEGRQSEIQAEIARANEGKLKLTNEEKKLATLSGDLLKDYLIDMELAQSYGKRNREVILDIIIEHMGFEVIDNFNSSHNFIEHENLTNGMIRKGATSAKKDERLVIPLNMRDGSLICVGKGNEDWNYSAPHGAGRLMSRNKAREQLNLDDFKTQMKNVYSTSVLEETLDEAPDAYKSAEEIIGYIKDTVDIVHLVRPVYNYKAH